ncbi:UNVERIFIED_CONTAM: Bifunctional 3-dehydroquinate dehydratase/shikimate dehydrogenase, chloroplastic [Sesamum indicum]
MGSKSDLLVCTALECESGEEMLSAMELAKKEGADIVELCVASMSFSHISELERLFTLRTLPSILSFGPKSTAPTHHLESLTRPTDPINLLPDSWFDGASVAWVSLGDCRPLVGLNNRWLGCRPLLLPDDLKQPCTRCSESTRLEILRRAVELDIEFVEIYHQVALKSYELVFDAVYTPRNTRLLQEAAEVGATVVSGVEMFIRQALGQFKLFTGGLAPEDFMRKIVLEQF